MPDINQPIELADLLKKKDLYLITRQISDTTQNLQASTLRLPSDHLIVDKERRVIKIGRDDTWGNTANHTHDEQYSPLVHGHYFGYGEKWFRSCPRLWARADLVNHPELVPCDGQVVYDEVAVLLQEIYSGTVTRHYEVDNSMMLSDLNEVIEYPLPMAPYATILKSYKISTDSVVLPKRWTLEGQLDADNSQWIALDSKELTNVTDYTELNKIQLDPVTTTEYCISYRLRVSSWFGIDDTTSLPAPISFDGVYLETKVFDSFYMPRIESPSAEFAYVVPVKDLEIGMKHEEIGDIGYSAHLTAMTPANRLPLDGRAIRISEEPNLYGICGQKYSPYLTTVGFTSDLLGNEFLPYTVEAHLPSKKILGKISVVASNAIYPISWTIHGYDTTNSNWIVVEEITEVSPTESISHVLAPSDFSSSEYRITITDLSDVTVPVGTVEIKLYGSDPDTYYLPDYTSVAPAGTQAYIVSKVRTEDINASVVLALQETLSEAQRQILQLTQRLIEAEVAIANISQP